MARSGPRLLTGRRPLVVAALLVLLLAVIVLVRAAGEVIEDRRGKARFGERFELEQVHEGRHEVSRMWPQGAVPEWRVSA